MDQTTRRQFVVRSAAAVAVVGGAAGTAAAQDPPAGPFRPAHHAQDDWFDSIPGRHRTFIDATTPHGAGEAILFANNLYVANKAGYGLNDADLAIVICMRHFATPFALGDAFWAKYGKVTGEMLKFNDPKTNQPPTRNVFRSADYGMTLPNLGTPLTDVLAKGTHIAICDMATHFFAGEAAKANGGSADAIYKEMVAAAPPNSHFVAAGVVGVNRAQERGYSLIYAG
jgi:hypothetical protein